MRIYLSFLTTFFLFANQSYASCDKAYNNVSLEVLKLHDFFRNLDSKKVESNCNVFFQFDRTSSCHDNNLYFSADINIDTFAPIEVKIAMGDDYSPALFQINTRCNTCFTELSTFRVSSSQVFFDYKVSYGYFNGEFLKQLIINKNKSTNEISNFVFKYKKNEFYSDWKTIKCKAID